MKPHELGGKSSYINGFSKPVPPRKKERKKWGKVLAILIVIVTVVSGVYIMFGSGESSIDKTHETYALVELKTPNTLQELKDSGVDIVHVYGYYALVRYTPKQVVRGVEMKPLDYGLYFQTGKFYDTSNVPPELSSDMGSTSMYMVQLIGPATPEWLKTIGSRGHIFQYYHNYAYLVKMDPATALHLKDLFFVKDVYPYQPLWKMHLSLYREMIQGNSTALKLKINVDPSLDIQRIADYLATEYGANVTKYFSYPKYNLAYVVAYVDRSKVEHILHEDFVISADIEHEIHLTNSVAARIVGAAELRDAWRNGLGLPVTGDGQVVEIADTGLDTGNPNTLIPDFAGRVITIYDAYGDGDPSDPDDANLGGHGTHVAGSVASSGVMSGSDPTNHIYGNSFAGMAPEAQIHFESIGTAGGYLGYDSITNMADRGYNDGARIWTNSWGSSDNTYTSDSDEVDAYMWNHKDFLILFAAGNDGPGPNTVGEPGTAKNIIAVGATENLRLEVNSQTTWYAYGMAQNPDTLAYFSSRGPTADGLMAPTVCAPGAGIVSDRPSTLSDSNTEYTWIVPIDYNGDGKYDYGAMQGTSMATPITAGSMVLVRDYYTDVEGLSDPSAALIKATAIGGAEPMPGYKYGGNDQGFGRINIARALIPSPPLSNRYWDWQAVDNGASWTKTVNIKTSEAPLRVVLTWTDVNSGSGAGIAQNNLDLKVVAPNGTEYHGNIFVGDSQWSQANPSSYDSVNVAEVVNVKNPTPGTWTIQVIGTNIGTDDPDGSGSLDQTFAVFALGPFGNQSYQNVRVERYNEDLPVDYDGYKEFTHKPIQKVLLAGSSFKATLKVVNWGNTADTYNIQYETNPSTTDISVSFDKTSVTLNPGESSWINATISAASGASEGLYELRLEAVSSSNTNIMDSAVFDIQLVPEVPVMHSQVTRTSLVEATSSIAIDPTDNSIWIAYFVQNSSTTGNTAYPSDGNGDNYDLMVAHSTDGGNTWTIYKALPNFYRYMYYAPASDNEQIMDWWYWYPSIDIDSNGKVYVAFGTGTHIEVVWGNENGWSNTSFENGQIYTRGRTTYYLIAYPWIKVYSDSQGNTWVFYTWLDTSAGVRDLKEVHTSDGGATWNGPNAIDSTGDSNDRRYFPGVAEFGGKLWLFVSQKLAGTASDTDYYIAYNTYDYGTSSWGSFSALYGTGTDGYDELQPTAYVDSAGRLWVSWYSNDDGQNSYFGVTENHIYAMYTTDGSSWSSVLNIANGVDVNDAYPGPQMGEDGSGNFIIGFMEENSYYTNTIHNENWVHYRYSLKMAIVDPSTMSISAYRYVDYGGAPIMHFSADSTGNAIYFSYAKMHEKWNSEIYFAKYGSGITDSLGPTTTNTMIWPPNTNNATKTVYIDLVYTKSMTLTTLLSDVESGNSNIASAEYFIDSIGTSGNGVAMNAEDGAFDSPVESATINIDPFSLPRGHHRIYVHAQDSSGNWGSFDYIDIYIFASQFKIYGWVNDSSGTPLANVAVNITDVNTGENVTVYTNTNGYYEYYIDNFPHAYSIGDKITVYADDGSDPGIIDGTYYDTNSTSISTAPGSEMLNLKLTQAVPEFGDMLAIILALFLIVLLFRRRKL